MKQPINPNYCATIVEINTFVPIENADAIQHAIVIGNSVIVGKNIERGEIGVFFPLECQLNPKFLTTHNLYRDKKLNANQEKAGFFESNGRVRAVRLRGAKSEGFFIPLSSIAPEYQDLIELSIGDDFDYLNGEWFCRKYLIKASQVQKERQGKQVSTKFNRLVDNQFHLHVDTINAKKAFGTIIKPDDLISITDKFHGTSAVFSNIIVKRELKWYEKFLLKLGVRIQQTEYDNIYSSRKVIKNQYINPAATSGFYGTNDVWCHFNEQLKDILPKGISVYGEIVGYLPGETKAIQKGYTYNCDVGYADLYVYRMTFTNSDGIVFEFTYGQIKDFCKKYGIKYVPEFYYGFAKDLYPDISVDSHWHQNVLHRLMIDFNLEKDCKYNPGMPAEGIVIRPERTYDCVPLKLKSFNFLQYETTLLDVGEEDIESAESAE